MTDVAGVLITTLSASISTAACMAGHPSIYSTVFDEQNGRQARLYTGLKNKKVPAVLHFQVFQTLLFF